MEIYLIRKKKKKIEKGICYGQSDLDITESFEEELGFIKPHLPATAL
ncbi:MAG: phosphoglycerate mutase, partial [Sphingobacteriia bacterium]